MYHDITITNLHKKEKKKEKKKSEKLSADLQICARCVKVALSSINLFDGEKLRPKKEKSQTIRDKT